LSGGQMELNAVVTQRVDVTPELMILRVVPDGWQLGEFKPGQYTVLGLPGSAPRCEESDPEEPPADPGKLIRRAYSIASSSLERQYVEFYITLVRSGALTPRLFALQAGDRVWMSHKIVGMFTLDHVPHDKNLVLLATGTGLAPYMSMLRTTLHRERQRRIVVVHGARHSWDLGYRGELITMERLCPNFSYLPVISRPAEEPVRWGGLTGYCQDVWQSDAIERIWGKRPTPQDTHVFLCGNPGMIEQMLVLLAKEGFREHSKKSPGQVHLEKYW